MQKVSCYLYPNRISVNAEMTASTREWRIVYQRMIKIYKGIDNVIEFDFKNSEQRRIDITGLTIKGIVKDQTGKAVDLFTVVPANEKGIGTAVIEKVVLEELAPQFLNYSLYVQDGNTQKLIYGDTQFDATGQMELLNDLMPFNKMYEVDNFIEVPAIPGDSTSYTEYYAIVDVYNEVFAEMSFRFSLTEFFGDIIIEFTSDAVETQLTQWSILDTINVDTTLRSIDKVYPNVDSSADAISLIKISYIPNSFNTGTIDKVIIRL